jgi:hypothetical protein
VAGADYGWPVREGTFVTDRLNTRALFALPVDDATRGFTYPVAQYDHGEGQAIVGGYVYRGAAVPALVGHYLFGDIVRGRIFHVPVADLRLGAQAPFRELVLKRGGVKTTLRAIIAQTLGRNVARADLRFGQDEPGEVYVVTKQDGVIRRMLPPG